MNIRTGKFLTRVVFSLIIMGIGTSIFFISEDNTMKIVGSNMVTAAWASWLPTGSSSPKKKKTSKIEEKGYVALNV